MNAATQVFNIPELMELILLYLPCDTSHSSIASMRTIHTSQTTSHTWHSLILESTPLRQRLYLPTKLDQNESSTWLKKTAFPPAEPNPWIPYILLRNQYSWVPMVKSFETIHTAALYSKPEISRHKFWTFSLELSRKQFSRFPPPGPWRKLLATSPPFTDFWYTRCFYHLGSGGSRWVTHTDYNAKVSKAEQKYRVHRPTGVTLGDLVDAWSHLFEKHSAAKYVILESVRCDSEKEVREEEPRTEKYLPGSSAEAAMKERMDWSDSSRGLG